MDLYSRMVAFFKVLLPLIALGILATLFLLSRGIDFDAKIPFAESEIARRTNDQRVTAPFFSGTTPGGDEIIVTAAMARPGAADSPAVATNVSARMTRASGARVTLDSDLARLDSSSDMATFTGDVRIATSTGMTLRTEVLNAALSGIAGNTPGTVTGTAPFGDLTAGTMEFGAKNSDAPLHMLFKQGVKLIYTPQKSEN